MMRMEAVVMKHLCIVLILCRSNVTSRNAVGHVVPQNSQLLLKTNGNISELYNSVGNGGSWLQAVLLFAREDPTVGSKTRCPNEFITLGDHCFYFSFNTAKWHDALQLCQSLGSDLAHPMSAVENFLLVNYLRNHHKGSNGWFIGGTDEEKEGEWVWAHNKARIVFGDWWDNQPNNAGNNEHCVHYWGSHDWKWNDTPCNNTARFICQP